MGRTRYTTVTRLLHACDLVVEDLLEEDDGPHPGSRKEEAGHPHPRRLAPSPWHDGRVASHDQGRLGREDGERRRKEDGVRVGEQRAAVRVRGVGVKARRRCTW